VGWSLERILASRLALTATQYRDLDHLRVNIEEFM
jgi:hypothetical protein